MDEAYYCFSLCYKTDKSLAMNLGNPVFIADTAIEISLFKLPSTDEDLLDNFRIYIELARIQSRINCDLRPASPSRRKKILKDIAATMDEIWKMNLKVSA